MDQMNRQRTYQNSRTPHVVKDKKAPLEENNTVVVNHNRKSIIQRIKEMVTKQKNHKS